VQGAAQRIGERRLDRGTVATAVVAGGRAAEPSPLDLAEHGRPAPP
jgi:hypothetical protein